MKQTITINDKRTNPKGGQGRKNIRLEILATELPGDCPSFTLAITDEPAAPKKQTPAAITATLERKDGKRETYTLPLEDGRKYAADWFSRIETVASDAPMEYSEERFSVCDTLKDIMANDRAFQILTDAAYSMSGIKITRNLAAMMGDRTLLELASALKSADGSGTGTKVPENALQIINAELNKITKGSSRKSVSKAGKRSGLSAQ
ncbi:MAG: hypothetical protein NC121_05920 [Blautia sp.]|nr:hypothetical protein [Blautia sp.]